MQRIDENTYIDDTLVTCAEYQLFIDEMREQGKYYQPDHWTTYQFPKGQSREPVIGIRYSDAISFCDWVKKIAEGNWSYRVPTSLEGEKYPLKFSSNLDYCYWTTGVDNKPNLTWIGKTHENIQTLIHLDATLDFVSRLTEAYSISANSDLDNWIKDANYLSSVFNTIRDRQIFQNRITLINSALNYAEILSNPNAHIWGSTQFEIFRVDLDRDRIDTLRIELKILKERIAGRSPAFEGIRLVKERIR